MKKILTLLLLGIFLVSVVPLTSAYFFKDHTYWVLKGFDEVDSPITQRCRPYVEQVLNGNHGSDIPVIHYFDEKVTSYIFTHQRSAYLTCQEEAGGDEELFCFCIGNALHEIQDFNSHSENGLVSKYLRKYGFTNLFGHMVIERNFENKNQQMNANDQIMNQVAFYDSRVLDLLFEETGGDVKYLEMLNEMSGIDMTQDAKVIRSGYQGESSFYNTVYADKVKLPFWGWALAILLILFGLGATIGIIWFGKTNWKWLAVLIWVIVAIAGFIILFSFFTGTTWKITTFIIEQPPKIGYLGVSDKDVIYYNQLIQEATNNFLETGNLIHDDASGLSYVDRFGVFHKGPLAQAGNTFKYIILPIFVALFVLLNAFLLYKTKFKLRRNRR